MQILVLPGDGIGPEITSATLAVLEKASEQFSLGLTFRTEKIGFAALHEQGTTMPESIFGAVKSADGVVLGPISHLDYPPRNKGGINVSGELRKAFDLYANIRPSRSRRGLSFAGKEMDLVIVRENTEGFYADRNMFEGSGEFMPTKDVALSLRKITSAGCHRIAWVAFELAAARRKKVTAVHKANVLKLTEGMFLREVRRVSESFPGISLDELLVDAMAAHLIRNPGQFDVIVTTNMFGDILSDEAAELSGSLGLAASLNVGNDCGVAQAQHGSAPGIAGQDRANPTSLIVSAAMLLDWLGRRHKQPAFNQAAAAIESAVDSALANPATRTADLGGQLGTKAFGETVAARVISPGGPRS